MADLSGLTTNFFATPKEGFTTTSASSTASGAATVQLNSVTGYTNGAIATFVIEPTSTTAKQAFTGVVDTAGVQLTSVVWTEGTNQTHNAGSTVVDYTTATHFAAAVKGIQINHDQGGNHRSLTDTNGKTWFAQTATGSAVNYLRNTNAATANNPILSADGTDSNIGLTLTPKGTGAIKHTLNYDAWVSGLTAPTTVTCNGNRSYTVVINGVDYTDRLSPGMRIRTTRTVAAPTYMGGAFNGTTQYFTKVTPTGTLSTVTDNFTIMGWVNPTSYAQAVIACRGDATSNNTIIFRTTATGQVEVAIQNGGAANFRTITSYQSIGLNKKTHVAVSWASGTVVIYIDGVSVPVGTASTGGTAPTVAGTGGDFSIGRLGASAGQFWVGYISSVGVFNAVLTAATIRSYMSQVLAGSETNCIGAWSLNNTANDQNAAANNLTAQGSVGFTAATSPYSTQADGTSTGSLDYAIITSATFSTNTTLVVQVPEGCTIPTSGGVSAVSYSTQKAPYGFPVQRSKWSISYMQRGLIALGTTANTFLATNASLLLPVGSWFASYNTTHYTDVGGGGGRNHTVTLSTGATTETDTYWSTNVQIANQTANAVLQSLHTQSGYLDLSAATTYFLVAKEANTITNQTLNGTTINAELAYL